MELKRNRNYFKMTSVPYYIGIALMALGVVLWVTGIRWYATPVVVAGMIVFGVMVSVKSSVRSIEDQIVTVYQNMDDGIEDKFGVPYERFRDLSPIKVDYYDFLADNILIKRGTDMTYRCSAYARAVMLCTGGKLKIVVRRVRLTEKSDEEEILAFGADEISSCAIEKKKLTNPCSKDREEFEIPELCIRNGDEKVFSMTVKDCAESERVAEGINEMISELKSI